jgi:ABC-type nitrate/sulfonate/bicarbonate transport system substrate-binding protein
MVRGGAVGMLLLGLLAGCSSEASPSPSTKAAPSAGAQAAAPCKDAPGTVTVAVVSSLWGINTANDFAMGQGFIKDLEKACNTKVKYQVVASGAAAIAAVAGGAVDFSLSSTQNIISAVAAGQKIVQVLSSSSGTAVMLIAPTKYKSRGTGVPALSKWADGTWGTVGPTGQSYTVAQLLAEGAGLNWDRVRKASIGTGPAAAAAIRSGRVDIAAQDYITSSLLIDSGDAFEVANPNSGPDRKRYLKDFSLGSAMYTSPGLLKKSPQLAGAMVKAELKGLLAAQKVGNNPTVAYRNYPNVYKQDVRPTIFKEIWQRQIIDLTGANGLATASRLASAINFGRDAGTVSANQAVPLEAFDNTFVVAAYKQLGLKPPLLQ